ncbi:TPA: CPBP family intramembrane metalloprotease [Candidatus Poribacteria bacterium]|nr:CPBP family intramembrane metalloprotease [Candidatus Poribacteria bacterium]
MTRKIALFLGMTFSINWIMAGLFWALGGRWNTPQAVILGVLYMFVPALCAVIVQKGIYRQPMRIPLGISFRLNRWFLVAWLLPPVLSFVSVGVSLLLPDISLSPNASGFFERYSSILPPERLEEMRRQMEEMPINPIWLSLIQGLTAGATINAVAAFGEELGWRGFLQRELSDMGFWRSSLLIGLIWGIWHAPIILQGHNYPQHPTSGVLMMTAFCLLLGPIFSYIRVKSRSVIAAAVAHGSLNGTAGISILILKGGSDLTVGLLGFAGLIVLALTNFILFLKWRRGGDEGAFPDVIRGAA